MLDASDCFRLDGNLPRSAAALSSRLISWQRTGCNIISLMETINDTYTPRSLNSDFDQWTETDESAPRRKGALR
jgi:hypothetical protein